MEVLEEYFGLGHWHGEPSIRVDGEPCDDDAQLRVTGKVVTVVTGRTEWIRFSSTCDHFRADCSFLGSYQLAVTFLRRWRDITCTVPVPVP